MNVKIKILVLVIMVLATIATIDAAETYGLYIFPTGNGGPECTEVETIRIVDDVLLYTTAKGAMLSMRIERHENFLLGTIEDSVGKHYFPMYVLPSDGSLNMAGKKFIRAPGDSIKNSKTGVETCSICRSILFRPMPGLTTKDAIREFAERSHFRGKEQIAKDGWIHPGLYCPNGCIEILINYRTEK